MSEAATRRSLLALFGVALVGACSRPDWEVAFEVGDDAKARLRGVLDGFTKHYGYHKTAGAADALDGEYEGWRSLLSVSHRDTREFNAAFHHKMDLWLALGPIADLGALLDDFKSRIAEVEGVRILEGY